MAEAFYEQRRLWREQVLRDPALSPLAFKLAYVISDHVHQERGYAWPSLERLAAECNATVNGVKKARDQLIGGGHLDMTASVGRGKSCEYRLLLKPEKGQLSDGKPQLSDPFPDEKEQLSDPFPDRKGQLSYEKPQLSCDKRATKRPPTLVIDPSEDSSERDTLSPPARSVSKSDAKDGGDGFETFWQTYPRRVGKGAARKAYDAALKRGASPEDLIREAARFAAERDREPDPAKREKFTPHPATWLNAERYADEPAPVVVQFPGGGGDCAPRPPNKRPSAFEVAFRGRLP